MAEAMDANGDHELRENEYPARNGESDSPKYLFTQEEKINNLTRLNDTLVKEVSSLRSDKGALTERVKKLEDELSERVAELQQQIQAIESERDSLLQDTKDLALKKGELLEELSLARKEVIGLAEEKAALLDRSFNLTKERESLEASLFEANERLMEVLKKLQDAEQAEAATKAKYDDLNIEYHKLCADNESLNIDLVNLVASYGEKEKEVDELQSSKAALEKEKNSLLDDVNKAVCEASNAREVIQVMRMEEEKMSIKNQELEKVLSNSLQQVDFLQNDKADLLQKICDVEKKVVELQHALEAAKIENECVMEIEKKGKDVLKEELKLIEISNKHLKEELKTTIQKMEVKSRKEQGQILMLEDQLKSAYREKERVEELRSSVVVEKEKLEELKNTVEVRLRLVTDNSAQAASGAKAEIATLKSKIEALEALLGKSKEEAKSSETKLWDLTSKLRSVEKLLEQKSTLVMYALPTAATSSLAFIGVLAFLKFRRH